MADFGREYSSVYGNLICFVRFVRHVASLLLLKVYCLLAIVIILFCIDNELLLPMASVISVRVFVTCCLIYSSLL